MPKKPVYATVEEVNEAKAEITELINDLKKKAATKNALNEAVEKIDADIVSVKEVVDANKEAAKQHTEAVQAELTAYSDDHARKVREEYDPQIVSIEEKRANTEAELRAIIDEKEKATYAHFTKELAELADAADKQFAELEEKLLALIEQRRVEAADALAEQRAILDDLRQKGERHLTNEIQLTRAETAAEFERRENLYMEANKQQDETLRRNRAELDNVVDNVWAKMQSNKELAAHDTEVLRDEAAVNLEDTRVALQRQHDAHDAEFVRVWDMYREVQEIPTRRVEWTISDAKALLDQGPPASTEKVPYRSWFSQRFRAAGTRNLRLELRWYRDGERGPGGSGDCSLVLWCGRGMHLNVRLFIADKWATTERHFVERGCEETKKICTLQDMIGKDGKLRLGVEFLEAIVELDDQSPLLTEGDAEEPPAAEEAPQGSEHGRLLFHRHINHRVVPQMRKEIERMQARMVRRIEWHVENASRLPSYFATREAICSPIFAAAGMEGLQLIFYPSGYKGATEGFCSMYLYCPGGISVRCTLSVGNQTRDAHNTFVEAGAYGRANFCMYEGTYDKQSNCLVLAFEIVDIKQELSAPTTHAVKPAPDGTERSPTAGAVKMLRVPGRESLTETKVLPALWTSKSLGDFGSPDDGFSGFETMKTRRVGSELAVMNPFRPGPAAAGAPAPSPPQAPDGASCAPTPPLPPQVRRSESSPALSPPASPDASWAGAGGGRAASGIGAEHSWTEEVSGSSLPMLKTTHGGLAGLSGPFVGQRRGGSRRLRSAPGPPQLGTMPIATHVPGLT
eukprot:TRINITY_DN55304_c0_g1_i1.p1 TRINITY_DN55304_c0_g1~~TRINITY_DN55304_c0_g1_i1.p1  ORF type:complete len:798 (-),score=201.97 TRINITY_DN55304_c0_g1_i1:98-2491(-)